nr:polymeric immunoglobulin receptor-like isoform X2 [Misgurnus anguillicaudatus]
MRDKEELNLQITEKIIEYKRIMKIILTFTLLMIPGALGFNVMGYSGGKVTITCKYEEKYIQNKKYFCKGEWRATCSDLIRTDIKDKWFQNGRFSLYDDTTALVFTVTITDLKIQDSGTYMCGVDIFVFEDSYTEVELTVKKDACCEIINLSVHSGESVNISCKYPQSHNSDVKFFCRRSGADKCAHETSVKESKRWTTDREFLLYDDRDQNLLYVTITNVTDHRSAEYWCGVQTEKKIFITQVQLIVNGASKYKTSTPPPSLSSQSSSSSSSSAYISSALVTPSLTHTSSVISSDSLFISLSVVLVLIIGLLLLMLILCKRHKRSGSKLSSVNTDITTRVVYSLHLPINSPDNSNLSGHLLTECEISVSSYGK